MTSSNGNIFRVTGPLCGEFTGHRWIPRKKASEVELWCFLWSAPEQTLERTLETPVIWYAIAPIMTSPQWVAILESWLKMIISKQFNVGKIKVLTRGKFQNGNLQFRSNFKEIGLVYAISFKRMWFCGLYSPWVRLSWLWNITLYFGIGSRVVEVSIKRTTPSLTHWMQQYSQKGL